MKLIKLINNKKVKLNTWYEELKEYMNSMNFEESYEGYFVSKDNFNLYIWVDIITFKLKYNIKLESHKKYILNNYLSEYKHIMKVKNLDSKSNLLKTLQTDYYKLELKFDEIIYRNNLISRETEVINSCDVCIDEYLVGLSRWYKLYDKIITA